MKLLLERIARKDRYTIGKLYIDGDYFCDTLEDTDRGLKQNSPASEILNNKVNGRTAIPSGIYKVTLDVKSPRFSQKASYNFCDGKLPRLLDVPGYEGVLIHIGNYPDDTAGCILVGKNKAVGAVMESAATFKKLYDILLKDKHNISIEIK
jgi:hypothetical protein